MKQLSSNRRRFLQLALASCAAASLPWQDGRAQPGGVTLADVNRMTLDAFVASFGDTFELAPWVAQRAYARRPFATVTALFEAMYDTLRSSTHAEQIAFLGKFSDLYNPAPPTGTITEASKGEHGSVGFDRLSTAAAARFEQATKAYKAKFGYTYVICVRRYSLASILSELDRHLRNDASAELEETMKQVAYISRLRVAEQVTGPGVPKVYGDVTAHVLNAMVGKPASGVVVELHEMYGDEARKVAQAVTTADGRADLMKNRPVPIGRYEMRFAIGDYFHKSGMPVAEPFFDVVPMRLFIAKSEESYHVPLIVTPFNYSTHG